MGCCEDVVVLVDAPGVVDDGGDVEEFRAIAASIFGGRRAGGAI